MSSKFLYKQRQQSEVDTGVTSDSSVFSTTFQTAVWFYLVFCLLTFVSSATPPPPHAACSPRWRRRTPPLGSSASAPSIRRTPWHRCCGRTGGHHRCWPLSPARRRVWSVPARPLVNRTGCPRGSWELRDRDDGPPEPSGLWCSWKTSEGPRCSRAGRRQRHGNRADGDDRTHPVREKRYNKLQSSTFLSTCLCSSNHNRTPHSVLNTDSLSFTKTLHKLVLIKTCNSNTRWRSSHVLLTFKRWSKAPHCCH